MTSTRTTVPPVDLKARIAAFQEQQKANASKQPTSTNSQTLPKPSAASTGNFRDRIASFEKQGAVPTPKSRFGFAPVPDESAPPKRHGELYGNRIPGLSRPQIPVPPTTKGSKKEGSKSRESTRLELERYATSPSPPGSPWILSENGDPIEEVLSDGYLTSADDPSGTGQEEAQAEAAISLAQPVSEAAEQGGEPTDSNQASLPTDLEQTDVVAPKEASLPPPAVVISPSEPDVQRSAEQATLAQPSESEPAADEPTALDPAVLAAIEQLDRATQSGDAGAVIVPADALQTFASLDTEQQKSVQDMLDQLLLQQDAIDIATPVKQRFSLNGQLSSQAVRDYLAQQSSISRDIDPSTPPRPGASQKSQHDDLKAPSAQYLSPTVPASYNSPGGIEEPLSPTSDIYSSYYAATPAVVEKFSRALPAIPEALDSPIAAKGFRRGTFGETDTISSGSSAPTSAPIQTPSDDGTFSSQQEARAAKVNSQGSVTPGDGMVRIAGTPPPRMTSPPLSVVIPQPVAVARPQPAVKKVEQPPVQPMPAPVVVNAPPPRPSPPPPQRETLAPAPNSASGSSSSSPASTYSPTSNYSGDGTSPSSTGVVSRKPSARKSTRSHVSPASLAVPFEEPELTPIEGPRGFHAVVHRKVVEGKSRPVSVNVQYPDLPSPSPMIGTGVSDLAALLADAVVFEKQLADNRTPSKKPRAAPQASVSPPPYAGRQSASDRPRPTQDLPESPDDRDVFARLSQDRSTARTSHSSGRPLPAQPRPPSRPPADRNPERSVERNASRPSLDRVPSRPSMDHSISERPSTDSASSSRPQLQPMFLTADPNVRIPLPPRPKSALAHASSARGQTSTPPPPPPPKSPPRSGYLTNLLSRAKSSGNLRLPPDSRDSVSSSEDSMLVATPPTPPYEPSISETGSIRRSSTMFKNSISRASNFADRLLHRKDGSHQSYEASAASEDDDDGQGGQRALPRPPRPLPLPPQLQPPRGMPPPVPGNNNTTPAPNPNNLVPIPPPGRPSLSRRGSWKSIASVSTTGISDALDNAGLYDSFPSVPETRPQSQPHSQQRTGLPSGPAAYTSPRPAPTRRSLPQINRSLPRRISRCPRPRAARPTA
ncbi:hypothetical protein C2E23DRAFT_148194 [Lenzites betulinus]|nr:hypothetical protein C2E23DRAFT_148194 [Lenzites betulinus]